MYSNSVFLFRPSVEDNIDAIIDTLWTDKFVQNMNDHASTMEDFKGVTLVGVTGVQISQSIILFPRGFIYQRVFKCV